MMKYYFGIQKIKTLIRFFFDEIHINLLNNGEPVISEETPSYIEVDDEEKFARWTMCDICGAVIYKTYLKADYGICYDCGYHFQMTSTERIELLLDEFSWSPFDESLSACDPLDFQDQKSYKERLETAQDFTGLQDAVQTGIGSINLNPVAFGVMDFNFMGGSMGSVVGEKLTRLIEYATRKQLYLIIVCTSGGARMQEGVLSLMQMAKISGALHIYQNLYKLFYISICTSPTTGGITASFAMLGDIIVAEPGALIGFAGRRVIANTLNEVLPEEFQTSEYLLKYGHLDAILSREYMKEAISEILILFSKTIYKTSQCIDNFGSIALFDLNNYNQL
jgi:acetyl-CoA carboxylase carboxyl transferase subunit beta